MADSKVGSKGISGLISEYKAGIQEEDDSGHAPAGKKQRLDVSAAPVNLLREMYDKILQDSSRDVVHFHKSVAQLYGSVNEAEHALVDLLLPRNSLRAKYRSVSRTTRVGFFDEPFCI